MAFSDGNWAAVVHDIGLAIAGAMVGGLFSIVLERKRTQNQRHTDYVVAYRGAIEKLGTDFIAVNEKTTMALLNLRRSLPENLPADPALLAATMQSITGEVLPSDVVDLLHSIHSRAEFHSLKCESKILRFIRVFLNANEKTRANPKSDLAWDEEQREMVQLASEILSDLGKAYRQGTHV